MPLSHNLIVWGLFAEHPPWHTTSMIRADALDAAGRHYDPALPTAEDIDLWMRLLYVTRFANLDEVLKYYRDRPESLVHTPKYHDNDLTVFEKAATKLLGRPVPGVVRRHVSHTYLKNNLLTEDDANRAIEFLLDLPTALLNANLLDADTLDDFRAQVIGRIKQIARHSPQTIPLSVGTVARLGRVHSPYWLRRQWGKLKGLFAR